MDQIKVELLDYMGDDLAVVDAARVSFNKTSEWQEYENGFGDKVKGLKTSDARLIDFLATHDHWTPFAHTALKFRVAAPVPIRTQCFKHKIGMVENEESRRYISTTPEIFVPDFFRAKPEGSIKQGSAEKHADSDFWVEAYTKSTQEAVVLYTAMIDDGVCPEQARFILPQGAIVNWIWTGNLVSFANFYLKRTDSHAQLEVQEVAKKVGALIEDIFPVSWAALTKE